MRSVLPVLFISVLIACKNSSPGCLKVTCLNPRDTISATESEIKTFFLVESTEDTLSNFDIRSACGCEHPVYDKAMKIYPGYPDTLIIVSSVKDHRGAWEKQTTIVAANCQVQLKTGPWYIVE